MEKTVTRFSGKKRLRRVAIDSGGRRLWFMQMFQFTRLEVRNLCFSILLLYFEMSFSNHFACFEAFQWTFHPYGFRGVVKGTDIFLKWEEWIGERRYWGPVVADGVNIERKGSAHCAVLDSEEFRSAESSSGFLDANKSWYGFEIRWWLLEEERIVTIHVNFGQLSFGPIWVFPKDWEFWSVSVFFRCLSIAYGGVKVWGVPSSFGCWGLEQGWGFGLLVIGRRRVFYFSTVDNGGKYSYIWVEYMK